MADHIRWIDDKTLEGRGVRLRIVLDESNLELESTPDNFILVKSEPMIRWYEDLAEEMRDSNILEIGIFRGGSVVLLHELLHPRKLVAIDLADRRVSALDEYITARDLADRLHPVYALDQADGPAVRNVVRRYFGQESLDLVIDDGCHLLNETRSSFNALIPAVRPGGLYVIEDWGWAHWPGLWQDHGGPWPDKPAMTLLVLELCMSVASRRDVVRDIWVRDDLVVVRKGSGTVDPESFDLSSSYLTAGRAFYEAGCAEAATTPSPLPGRIVELENEIHELTASRDAAEQRADDALEMLHRVEQSVSWRLTAPLRRISQAVGPRR